MGLDQIPPTSQLTDQQYLQISGPDGLLSGYQYSAQQRTLYFKEAQVLYPSFHGWTHIAQDPVPEATCDTHGLMSSNDKCKLDALIGTRVGVLGFMGSGFPDDGGWLQGDIILAAGTEFISLERVGNLIRFTVDSPVPLNCSCESCAQIFWVQDETDVSAVRTPTCGGKMPGINGYGELKIYAFPASTIFDPNNPAAKLNLKDQYPSLSFTRYENGTSPNTAEFQCILQRSNINNVQATVGWMMSPGVSQIPQFTWYMGLDSNGNQITFDLDAETTPGMLGGLLYNGNSVTKRPAVIVDYNQSVLSNNQYVCAWWDTDNHKVVGSARFTATNVWQYNNPASTSVTQNPQSLVLDSTVDLLPVGTVVDITFFQVGVVAGTPINHYYFTQPPQLIAQNTWNQQAAVQFGETLIARYDYTPDGSPNQLTSSISQIDERTLERSVWGMTGTNDPLVLFNIFNIDGFNTPQINVEPLAVIDNTLPGLVVQFYPEITASFNSERPVWLWNRHEYSNLLARVLLGSPAGAAFKPLDIMLGAPIDSREPTYMQVLAVGTAQGKNYMRVKGTHFNDMPHSGAVRVISPGGTYNQTFNYSQKVMWTNSPDDGLDSLVLLADASNNFFNGNIFDIVELLHQDYNGTCLRIESIPGNDINHSMTMQFKVGELNMSLPYENASGTVNLEDYVRGLSPGYAISQQYSQAAGFSGVGAAPTSVPTGFVIYDGGFQGGGTQTEYWNTLDIMLRGQQVWVWWNNLLITPSTATSASLPNPVSVSTPYFPVNRTRMFGKFGMRMWPGTKLRSVALSSQAQAFSEFTNGQLVIS